MNYHHCRLRRHHHKKFIPLSYSHSIVGCNKFYPFDLVAAYSGGYLNNPYRYNILVVLVVAQIAVASIDGLS